MVGGGLKGVGCVHVQYMWGLGYSFSWVWSRRKLVGISSEGPEVDQRVSDTTMLATFHFSCMAYITSSFGRIQ